MEKRTDLQKDKMYAIDLNWLGTIVPGVFDFCSESNYADKLANGKGVEEYCTLLRYAGGGKFIEYYSGEVILLCTTFYNNEEIPTEGLASYTNEDALLSYSNEVEFEMKKSYYLINPLFVDAENLKDVDEAIISKINEGAADGKYIRDYITKLKSYAQHELSRATYRPYSEELENEIFGKVK